MLALDYCDNNDIMMLYAEKFNFLIKNEKFVTDKTGSKMVEIIAPVMTLSSKHPILNLADVKKTNEEYVKQELDWYLSQNLSIIPQMEKIKIWNDVATKDDKKEINSNYGWCIFSEDNGNQYSNCLAELIKNPESRRAVMIYTRPTMWEDYKRNGMSDFICTDGVQCFIRENKLIYIVKQRSCDFVFGFFNDFAWHCYVHSALLKELQITMPKLKRGALMYIPFSLHVYERHFDLIKKIIESYKKQQD